ncbi:MAG: hypothetical protein ACP5RP_04545 [Candidatus Micrarchaeia archaeon]
MKNMKNELRDREAFGDGFLGGFLLTAIFALLFSIFTRPDCFPKKYPNPETISVC